MIPYEARWAVYTVAWDQYGSKRQIWKVVEEMAELTVELAKLQSGGATRDSVIDEITDVTIMMEQLKSLLGLNEVVQDRMDFKIRRLAERLGVPELLEGYDG